jgi:hypothetical protein
MSNLALLDEAQAHVNSLWIPVIEQLWLKAKPRQGFSLVYQDLHMSICQWVVVSFLTSNISATRCVPSWRHDLQDSRVNTSSKVLILFLLPSATRSNLRGLALHLNAHTLHFPPSVSFTILHCSVCSSPSSFVLVCCTHHSHLHFVLGHALASRLPRSICKGSP